MREVVIVYRHVPRYRLAFYEALREYLAAREIRLELIYGQPIGEDRFKYDSVDVSWGRKIRNLVVPLGRANLCYQPAFWRTRSADLVIVEQASRLLLNYALILRQSCGGTPVAMWGHGWNRQSGGGSLSRLAETAKRHYTRWSCWFFAYTSGSASRVLSWGFPPDRLTVVQNSAATGLSARDLATRAGDGLAPVAEQAGRYTCVYVGSLYKEKKLDYLLRASEAIQSSIPDFKLVVVGDGPDRAVIEDASRRAPWIIFTGALHGDAKARAVAGGQLLLMPGLVGLVVIDSFALEMPLVTTSNAAHSPEIEYLEDGVNGIVTDGDPEEYAARVVEVLEDEETLERLKKGCRSSAQVYSLASMVDRFGRGVEDALPKRG